MPIDTRFHPDLRWMGDLATDFCGRMAAGESPCWLSLLGASGIGKTATARGIVDWYNRHLGGVHWVRDEGERGDRPIRRKAKVVYWLEWLRTLDGRGHDLGPSLYDLSRSATLLVIDDIGAEYEDKRGYLKSALYDLLAMRENRWTVITANLGMEDLGERIDTRLTSRMARNESLICELLSPDLIDWNSNLHPRHHRRKAA